MSALSVMIIISVLIFHKHDTVCFIPAVTVTSICSDPLYVLHIILNDSMKESTSVVQDFLLLEPMNNSVIIRILKAWSIGNGNWKHHNPKLKVFG